MVRPMLYKNIMMKIRKSIGRYVSLFLIVLIGVGFYAGIQASAPDIQQLTDTYTKEHQLMDIKVVSTMGLTKEDISAVKELDPEAVVIGSYSLDALSEGKAVRLHAIEDDINQVSLKEGRMPQSPQECLGDARTYQIGDQIHIADSDNLKQTDFTVTGLIDSALYIGKDYGSTIVGDGKLSAFLFVDKAVFSMDAYTELYIRLNSSDQTSVYTTGYDQKVAQLKNSLISIKEQREQARYQTILQDGEQIIAEHQKTLDTNKAEGMQQLQDAKLTLDDAMQQLTDGKQELSNQKAALMKQQVTQLAVFADAQQQIEAGWSQIHTALSQANLEQDALPGAIAQLHDAILAMQQQLTALPVDSAQYVQLSKMLSQTQNQRDGLVQLQQSIQELSRQEQQLQQGRQQFQTQLQDAKEQLATAEAQLLQQVQLVQRGYTEYHENLTRLQEETTDAQQKITKAKEDLTSLEQPKWIISDREAVIGYDELGSEIEVVSSVAQVFPVFFILIAMLMTSNTMSRMIAEERGELGIMTSLGYHDHRIISTYLLYVLSATIAGGVVGFFLGSSFFPPLIFVNFDCILPPLVIHYNWMIFGCILIVSIALMSAVTIYSCHSELKDQPANLIRPLPPKHGQKILLERISSLWNRFSFTWKVTLRNLFRYKKRAFMTIVGVAGCSSLLLVGFGLRGSMNGVADKQYGEIFQYETMMVLQKEQATLSSDINAQLAKQNIIDPLLIKQSAITCLQDEQKLDAFLITPQTDEFLQYFHLRDRQGNTLALQDQGVIVTQKIADTYHLQDGDPLLLSDADNQTYETTITGIAENYISSYVYLSPKLYESLFQKSITYNSIVSKTAINAQQTSELMEQGSIINITNTSDIRQTVLDGNARLNSIIVLLIVVASLLAFIVLYNLTSINISERKREIATLKVLGFRDNETNAYIYREALLLSLISILIGLLLGIVLHRFVIIVIEGTTRVLFKEIAPSSFLIAGGMTLLFSLIMQLITYAKLKTIDMVESLKSVE